MSEGKLNKFENPVRLAELDPEGTLRAAGFSDGMSLCDIGAGTGVFSIPAARISRGKIYALEASDAMIALLENRRREQGIDNLEILKVTSRELPLEDGLCDMAVMVTVLHEIDDKKAMLDEAGRILKADGKLLVIEFHKWATPMGPPAEHRISKEEVKEICISSRCRVIEESIMGENFYKIIFSPR
ncbi:class I SAM-dependent methyltransferase [Parasporobacterium paucivorans]|uniref:Methyltransferase domain-containing protein n=1 Tax=Parasporobacterium paucivorans DSM 15970 TaxID=1122934 RepID=A0A1M6GNC4_9FIRM|nr:class I SAM-dependent methyltransferase [Parasporobacterium paucivorans]SHJ11494.1 Methyltransferase domain-containing protein [Parasporobacterium paucivorans DSM 15970]